MSLPLSISRDIDEIILAVRQKIPDVIIKQLQKRYIADDDGIWWFALPGNSKDIQLESSSGNCPFLVETDEQSSYQSRTAYTVAEAMQMIVDYLR